MLSSFMIGLGVLLSPYGSESVDGGNPSARESVFVAKLLAAHRGTLSVAAFVDEVECEQTCARTPEADTSIPKDLIGDLYTTRLDLTAGAPGICADPDCTGSPCKWTFKIELTNGTGAGGQPGTITVKTGADNSDWDTGFGGASLDGSVTVSNTGATVGTVSVGEKSIPCDTVGTNSVQAVYVELTYTVNGILYRDRRKILLVCADCST